MRFKIAIIGSWFLKHGSPMRSSTFSILVLLIVALPVVTGCNTLSSLGLSFGGGSNKLLDPAKEISQAPGRSLLQPAELTKQPLDVYIVEIGDTVLLEATKFDATIRLPGDQVVKPDGYISLGECGRMIASNKSIDQIRVEAQAMIDQHVREGLEIEFELERRQREKELADLDSSADDDSDADLPLTATASADDERAKEANEARVALERQMNRTVLQNEISARLVNWESKRIYVLGEVNSPGSFTFLGNETVLDALIEAGGLTSRTNHHQIIVTRPSTCNGCRTVMSVCYDQIVQLGDTSTNYQLLPGDRVFVPSLTFKDDLRQSLGLDKSDRCPRCAECPTGCDLPQGCLDSLATETICQPTNLQ